jgi:hypothetical protein
MLVVTSPALLAAGPLPPERPDQPYVAPAKGAPLTIPRARSVVSAPGVRISQVNVSPAGLNLANDAANEPSLCIDPTRPNRIAVGWRQFDTIASNFRQAGVSFSRDAGRTWAPISRIAPGVFRSDPVLRAGPEGRFYYNSLQVSGGLFICFLHLSDDGGATWGPSIFAAGGDKTWMEIDRTAGPGRGNLYQAWNLAGNQYAPATFSRSTDAGFNWDIPSEIPFSPVFGTLSVGNDGELFIIGTDFSSNILLKSTNANDPLAQPPTFEQVTVVNLNGLVVFQPPVNPAGLAGQLWVDIDRTTGINRGNVYVCASVNPPGPDPLDIYLARGVNNGLFFEPPVRINTDSALENNSQWFGMMAVAPNGRIDVVWNDTRHDPTAQTSRLYYRFSTNGALSWSAEVPLTEPFNHSLGYPQQNKLGDYYDLASDNLGVSIAMAATFNGEQDVYFVRVGPDDCNRNDIADDAEIASNIARDCNSNGIIDDCDIASGALSDADGNGVPDPCQTPACYADTNRDGIVNFGDISTILAEWSTSGPAGFRGDADASGTVGFADITTVLSFWLAACP